MASPSLTVLHLVGSSETRFYFECSFLYAKESIRLKNVKNYYAILLPPLGVCPGGGRVVLLEDEIPRSLSADDLMDLRRTGLEDRITTVSVAEFLGLLGRGGGYFRHPPQLVVPHMFDKAGMTTWRMTMEDVLRLPVAGMSGEANVFAQDKVATRMVLGQLERKAPDGAEGENEKQSVYGVIPKGFAVWRRELSSSAALAAEDVAPLIERVRAEAGGFPVMLKSPLEDNSRGLFLVGKAHAEEARGEISAERRAEL